MSQPYSNDQAFIAKLKGILEENFHKENFGVTELALAMGISRSQLHRKLNRLMNISTSEFIKLYRLEKAHAFLEDQRSTVSEIAYAVGFGSPSYFSKCFQDHYEYSPTEVRRKQDEGNENDKELNKSLSSSNNKRIKKKWLFIGVILMLFLVILVSFAISGSSVKRQEEITIGILPFKNLSDDSDNQYFADGVMEEILNHLSNLENLNVLSRTTMENYQGQEKTVPEIAKELNMTHVLEASVQKYDERVRIVVQLIDAKADRHIWADSYDRDYQNIFNLQSDIAKEVAKQLERKLTVSNIAKLEKAPAENVEAYNLYLKGRFFWQRRKEEDLKKSIQYFEEAINLESNYALAYAGLADAYYIMAVWGWYPKIEGYAKGKEYAKKALSIDDKIAAAHATLGAIAFWHEWNWNIAEREIKKAIEIDPSYASAHLYYAILLDILGRKKEAREQIDMAIKLYPNSAIMFNISAIIYYNNNEFDDAIRHLEKGAEIRDEIWYAYTFRNYMRLGEENLAYQQLKHILARKGINKEVEIDNIFNKYGVKGVLECCIDDLSFSVKEQYYNTAAFLCLVDQHQKALDYLEKSYQVRETHIPRIKHSIDFNFLRDNPRFVALLQKMNLK